MVRAFMDAGAPLVPAAAETENGFRKLCLADRDKGLVCASGGTGPAQVAVAIKTALTALNGDVVPQSVRLPLAQVEDPDFKAGDNVYPDQTDNFFVGNAFPTCGINFTAQEIMGRSEANQ
jgi:ribose transport system substrate-binding protein